jgi:hypothetical protein
MKIDTLSSVSFTSRHVTEQSNVANCFSEYFANSMNSEKTPSTSSSSTNDHAEIKEKGLLNFVQEQREAKLREKILSLMGISEEELASMPPSQRAKIEETIAEEIQERLAAAAELKGEKDPHQLELIGQLQL